MKYPLILLFSMILSSTAALADSAYQKVRYTDAINDIYQKLGDGYSNPQSIYPCSVEITKMKGYLHFVLSEKSDYVRSYPADLLPTNGYVAKIEYDGEDEVCYDSLDSHGQPSFGNDICIRNYSNPLKAWITIPRRGQSNGGCAR
jgi:hypothetical protein